MTVQQILLIVFGLLIFGLMLPLSSGQRTAVFMALMVVSVLTFIGGGMHYALSFFQ